MIKRWLKRLLAPIIREVLKEEGEKSRDSLIKDVRQETLNHLLKVLDDFS